MSNRADASRTLAWYRDRWEELMDLLPTSEPDDVVDQVRELQISVLDEEAEALEEMGLTDAEEAKTVLERIFERLQKLRRENQILHRLQEMMDADSPAEVTDSVEDLRNRVERFEDRESLLAESRFDRPENALQALIHVEEQLEDLYDDEDTTEDSVSEIEGVAGSFPALEALLARERTLQRELGVSSPDALTRRIEGLTDQLSSLYEDSEQLAELDLEDTEATIQLLQSMQEQLESLYERLDQTSGHDTTKVDALARSAGRRNERSEEDAPVQPLTDAEPLLPAETVSQLEDLDAEGLDSLPVGVFAVDDQAVVQRTNADVLRWPDVDVEDSDALVGTNFFHDVAPAANNALFRGRFENGVADGALDEQFSYTYVSEEGSATNLIVLLHRKPDQSENWIVFRVL